MTDAFADYGDSDLDRVRELTSIGAGHAAKAFADLLGRPCRMRVPVLRILAAERVGSPFVTSVRDDEHGEMAGVFFEVEGGLNGVLAVLLAAPTRDLLLEHLVGRPAARIAPETAQSALREFGNILVSHVASAMADTLGAAVLPSIPLLVPRDAPGALASLVGLRVGGRPTVRIETEIGDRPGEVRAILVFLPDHTTVVAAPERV